MPRAPGLEAIDGAAVGERAARLHVGHEHDTLGVQDFRRLGHEVHAGEDDDVRLGLLRRLRELQRIADDVREVLDLTLLVVVSEQDRVALLLQAPDLVVEVQASEVSVDGRRRHGHGRLYNALRTFRTPPRALGASNPEKRWSLRDLGEALAVGAHDGQAPEAGARHLGQDDARELLFLEDVLDRLVAAAAARSGAGASTDLFHAGGVARAHALSNGSVTDGLTVADKHGVSSSRCGQDS